MQFFLIPLLLLCDNIQLEKSAFKSLRVGGDEYLSYNMPDNSTLRISYPGYLIYKLEEIKPGYFLLMDRTVYVPYHNSLSRREREFLFIAEVVENPYYTSWENIKISLFLANLTASLSLLFFKVVVPIWSN